MSKIGIGYCAYISNEAHFRYAKETLESAQSKEHELVFCGVVNYVPDQNHQFFLQKFGRLLVNPENNVSMGWNKAINNLFSQGCDYVIVPNLDVVFKSDMIDKLIAFADSHQDGILLWTAMPWNDRDTLEEAIEQQHWPETPHFSVFMVDVRLFNTVGEFDEKFKPAYNEDLDMHWRIVLSGNKAVGYEGARFHHYVSRTINEDPDLRLRNNRTHYVNNLYFLEKWGDKPATAADPFLTEKMYRTPFNK